MTEAEIEMIINQHLFSYRGRCECGEYLGPNPISISKHLAQKIHEEMSKTAGH